MEKSGIENLSKSEVIGHCGGDEQTEWPRRTDKSRTLKKIHTVLFFWTLKKIHTVLSFWTLKKIHTVLYFWTLKKIHTVLSFWTLKKIHTVLSFWTLKKIHTVLSFWTLKKRIFYHRQGIHDCPRPKLTVFCTWSGNGLWRRFKHRLNAFHVLTWPFSPFLWYELRKYKGWTTSHENPNKLNVWVRYVVLYVTVREGTRVKENLWVDMTWTAL